MVQVKLPCAGKMVGNASWVSAVDTCDTIVTLWLLLLYLNSKPLDFSKGGQLSINYSAKFATTNVKNSYRVVFRKIHEKSEV